MEFTGPALAGTLTHPTLKDRFGRTLDYLRLAVTERCNLRCTYCMPESGVLLKPRAQILTYEEMLRLVNISVAMGVKKVRITGGEPMTRKGIMDFLRALNKIPGLEELHLTTNGFWGRDQISELDSLDLAGINFSLDSLNPGRFKQITRRDAFTSVWETLMVLIEASIPLKINAVIQRGINEDEIIELSELAKVYPLDVRFIEQMPFNGGDSEFNLVTATDILAQLQTAYPMMSESTPSGSTADLYEIQGFKGRVGVIAAYSRTFCATCNRLRITSTGHIKTCLYDGGDVDLRTLLRSDASDESIAGRISEAILTKSRDGFEAERMAGDHVNASMSTIGG